MINYGLPEPITGYVAEKYLYDLDETKTDFIPATIVGISSYPGDALALTALLADGSLFAYLPLDAFTTRRHVEFSYRELVYHNCPSGVVAVSVLATLPKTAKVFLKRAGVWRAGEYIATLDWYEGNDLLHLMLLDNGQLAAVPNHKVKFGQDAPERFLPYRKLRQTWRV